MNIYGNGEEILRFKYMDATGTEHSIDQTLVFTPESIIGSRNNPYLLTPIDTDIETTSANSSRVVSTTYYTLGGLRISQPSTGMYIKHIVYEDGNTIIKKIVQQ